MGLYKKMLLSDTKNLLFVYLHNQFFRIDLIFAFFQEKAICFWQKLGLGVIFFGIDLICTSVIGKVSDFQVSLGLLFHRLFFYLRKRLGNRRDRDND